MGLEAIKGGGPRITRTAAPTRRDMRAVAAGPAHVTFKGDADLLRKFLQVRRASQLPAAPTCCRAWPAAAPPCWHSQLLPHSGLEGSGAFVPMSTLPRCPCYVISS
jgi:hypothetical protein